MAFTVSALDVYNNVGAAYSGTMHFSSSDAQAVLPADYTFTDADAGIHAFTATLGTVAPGGQTITATDFVAQPLARAQMVPAISAAIAVTPTVAASLQLFGGGGGAGAVQTVTVSAVDAFGNFTTSYNGTVHLSSDDPATTVSPDAALLNGVGTFQVTPVTLGTQTLTATDVSAPTITGAESVSVTPGSATRFALTPLATVMAGMAQTFTLTAYDYFGDIATNYTGTVTFSSSDFQSSLPASYTFSAADAGVQTFSAILATAGSQSITATDTAASAVMGTASGIVTPAAATRIVIGNITSQALFAGPQLVAGQVQSEIIVPEDPFGNFDTSYAGTVNFTSSDPQAVLPASYVFGGDGVLPSLPISFETAGVQSVTVTDLAAPTLTGNRSFTVGAAAAAWFSLAAPATAGAGLAQSLTLTARDAFGNIVSGTTDPFAGGILGSYSGTVAFSSSDVQAGLPSTYTFVGADAGVHTFKVTFKTAGSQSITATDTGSPTVTGTETGIAVTPAAATVLALTGFPASTAGVAESFTVTAKDPFGNIDPTYTGSVAFSSSDSQAGLPASYTFTAADAGTHTFSATLKSAGTRSLAARDLAAPTVTGAETGIVITPARAASFVVAGASAATAGVTQAFTITAKDPFGNVATAYGGTVQLASSDPATPMVGGTLTNGVGTFPMTPMSLGAQTLTAIDSVNSAIVGTEAIFVSPGWAARFDISPLAAAVAGGSQAFTVTGFDKLGNVSTVYRGTVLFSSSDRQAGLPFAYTFTAADAGRHTFNVAFRTAGAQSLTVRDLANAAILGTQAGVAISSAAASSITVTPVQSGTAGDAQTVTVTAHDPFGNVATGYRDTLTFGSNDPLAALPADYTFTAADAGTHAFTVTFKSSGDDNFTVKDTANATNPAFAYSQLDVMIVPAALSSFEYMSPTPSNTIAGTSFPVSITALDAFGNTVKGYAGTAHFASSDLQAVLPADYTFTSADAGKHIFNAALDTAGTQSITIQDTADASTASSVTGIVVKPAAAAGFTITGFPTATGAGAAQTFTLTVADAFGNPSTGYRGTVSFSSSDKQAGLPAGYTFTTADAGSHTFQVVLKTAGTQSVVVTDSVAAALTASLSGISVTAGATASLAVTGFPATTAGVAQSFKVMTRDAFGNISIGYTGTVVFSSSDAKAGLPASYTFTAADAGVHIFTATLKTAGSQSLTVKDAAAATITGSQTGVIVGASATPASLSLAGFPATAAGVAHTFTVTVRDAFGNLCTNYSGTVTFSSSDVQAGLPASYTFMAADAGVHTFTATLKTAGAQSLTVKDATAANILGSQTGIAVTAGAATQFSISAPTSVTQGVGFKFTVTVLDAYGNVATGYRGKVHLSSTDAKGGSSDYTFSSNDNGVHVFSYTFNTLGAQTLKLTDAGNSSLAAGATVTVSAK